MAEGKVAYQTVPSVGPLELGAVYRRKHLNDRFGGNRMSGIVTSPREPIVLLFHTEEPSQQFYTDGFDSDGVYWYSGEGTIGDMEWTRANRAIRDHMTEGRDLLLFERVQRKEGLWRYSHAMRYLDYRQETRPDKEGHPRQAIVFGLITDSDLESPADAPQVDGSPRSLESLREAISELAGLDGGTPAERIQRVYKRSAIVADYARARAAGICEACGIAAPFKSSSGEPFLEVHHIDRLADGGADSCEKVAAVCPNCHRRIHYGVDGAEYNHTLTQRIANLELAG
jgi:5-methylcytosine-specific restriction protein A